MAKDEKLIQKAEKLAARMESSEPFSFVCPTCGCEATARKIGNGALEAKCRGCCVGVIRPGRRK